MKAMNSAMVFKEDHADATEMFVSPVQAELFEGVGDQYDEPGFFFKGAVLGLLLCLPFWAVICWIII